MIRVLKSLWIWLATGSLIVFWVPLLGVVWLLDRDPRKLLTGRWFRRLGRMISRVNPWRIHVSGAANAKPGVTYVLVSNHQSLGDIPLISHLRVDAKWLGKAEVFRLPFAGWMMRMAGDIPVVRGDRRKAAASLLRAAHLLREGCSIVTFPEGTRSRTGEVLPFNDGPFQLAIREQVPVLPLVVDGSGAALPRNTWLFGGAQDIFLRVLEPQPVDGWNVKQSSQLREMVRERMVAELESIRRGAAPQSA
jgi:1-acyl-sn-glycerol-3-phosphate acyltransferase